MDLESRVQELEDRDSILRTLYRYGYCLDYGLREEWVSLFTPDAHYVTHYIDGEVRDRTGRELLVQFATEHPGAPEQSFKHIVSIPFIELHGDEATVESYFYRIDAYSDGPVVKAFGRYSDRMVKLNGEWLFAERIARIESMRGARSTQS